MKDVEIIGMLKSFVKATLVGMGALKGAPCQCVITTNADGTHKVTMMWVDNEGDSHTGSFDVLNGQVGDLKDLGDVTLAGLQEGQTLSWDAVKQKWVNAENSATVNTLNAVGDVTITSVQDGEVLVWDDTASKWVNKALTASDISGLANVATSGDYDDLENKPTIPAAQIQSDWSQSNNTKADFIKNKPTIPAAQIQSDWSQSDNTKADFIKNKPTLANVATSGDYDDLENKPTIPAAQIQSDWSQSDNTKADFIKNKPTLGTAAAKDSTNAITQNSTDLIESGAVHTGLAGKADKTALATVATSGSYNDLSNKPTIPAAQIQSDWSQSDNTKLDFIKNKPSLLQLGETSSTAYCGNRGKTAYNHSQITDGTNPHATTANNINLATALTINGASKTTAEAAISALAGLVDNITDTEYNAISAVLGN